nr:dihydrofolate reductase [Gordonia humi]
MTGAIGKDNTIPWRIPEDLARFKKLSGSGAVLMGRRTWESLPVRFRPLPGRRNIVITRNAAYQAPGAETVAGLSEAVELAGGAATIMGGSAIYEAGMAVATHLYVTEVDILVDGADTFGPEIDPNVWTVVSRGEWLTSRTGTRYRFVDYRHVSR